MCVEFFRGNLDGFVYVSGWSADGPGEPRVGGSAQVFGAPWGPGVLEPGGRARVLAVVQFQEI